jgi:hypothetical protein
MVGPVPRRGQKPLDRASVAAYRHRVSQAEDETTYVRNSSARPVHSSLAACGPCRRAAVGVAGIRRCYVPSSDRGPGRPVAIVTTAGRTIEPIKDSEQVGFAKPQISPDGGAVGWLAEYPNCRTSYPVPLKLEP